MRRLLFLLFIFTVVATSAIGVSASTDCERWIASYKQSLTQQNTVKQLKTAKLNLRRYALRKIAAYTSSGTKPGPRLVRASSLRPRLTPQQMLRRFSVLCGELPETMVPGVLDAKALPTYKFDAATFEPMETESAPAPGFLAQNAVPAFPAGSSSPTSTGAQGLLPPSFGPILGGGVPSSGTPASGTTSSGSVPGGTTSGVTAPGGTTPGGTVPGGTTTGGTTPGGSGPSGTTPGGTIPGGTLPGGVSAPGSPTLPPDLPIAPPTQTPVPEPGSITLLLTGILGGGRLLRRKLGQ